MKVKIEMDVEGTTGSEGLLRGVVSLMMLRVIITVIC
jgi:hypothetical protein